MRRTALDPSARRATASSARIPAMLATVGESGVWGVSPGAPDSPDYFSLELPIQLGSLRCTIHAPAAFRDVRARFGVSDRGFAHALRGMRPLSDGSPTTTATATAKPSDGPSSHAGRSGALVFRSSPWGERGGRKLRRQHLIAKSMSNDDFELLFSPGRSAADPSAPLLAELHALWMGAHARPGGGAAAGAPTRATFGRALTRAGVAFALPKGFAGCVAQLLAAGAKPRPLILHNC